MFKFADQYIKALLKAIFEGTITQYELPANLYFAIADHLKSAVYKGFGIDYSSLTKKINEKVVTTFNTSDLELLTELRTNIYMFSAAKTYQQVKEMTSSLIKDNGELVSFKEFKSSANEIFQQYNKTWLSTEYETAIGQAQEAVKWNKFEKQKDVLPYLRYSAIMDASTSVICAPLNGVVAKVDDKIWNTISPLNHFRCRCILEQFGEDEIQLTGDDEKNKKVSLVENEMQDVFKMNAGKDGYVFKHDHPYFTVPRKERVYAAHNFNLPIPKTD